MFLSQRDDREDMFILVNLNRQLFALRLLICQYSSGLRFTELYANSRELSRTVKNEQKHGGVLKFRCQNYFV